MHESTATAPVRLVAHKGSSGEVLVPSLRSKRMRLALSQEDLAEKAGVGRTTIARAERGKPIRPSSVRKIAQALKVSPWALQQPDDPPG